MYPQVLRKLADIIARGLMIMFERPWRSEEVPEDCKKANVTLVFKKGKPCLTCLIAFYGETATSIDEGKVVDIVYFSFSKAFSTDSHNILIAKLRNCGLDSDMD
ncbi:hypothetical protein DUI87_06572 [Hirundo rustica rustica]|uniref:Reverse transcriptase domain-containing protein n=1 Tax=Hirundo rustica rustica TaxID=333673 RepID=A0A3M0KYS6_HIRRU|nr:hypothetical protein DUI87_06572 [Hirundo rustica rustica]